MAVKPVIAEEHPLVALAGLAEHTAPLERVSIFHTLELPGRNGKPLSSPTYAHRPTTAIDVGTASVGSAGGRLGSPR